jgi:RHS repeat-associated protein
MYYDEASLVKDNARWYDPRIIGFNVPDTLIPDLYNPLDYNRFGYARYNPLKYTDPTGHSSDLVDSLEDDVIKIHYYDYYGNTAELKKLLRKYGVMFTGNWSAKNITEISIGVAAVGEYLEDTLGYGAEGAFRDVFQPIKLKWVDSVCGTTTSNTCYADAYSGPGTLKFYKEFWFDNEKNGNLIKQGTKMSPQLVVHELGHVLDQLTNYRFREGVKNKFGDDDSGMRWVVGGKGYWETTADMFLNHVMEGFFSNAPGKAKQMFMEESMNFYINVATQY